MDALLALTWLKDVCHQIYMEANQVYINTDQHIKQVLTACSMLSSVLKHTSSEQCFTAVKRAHYEYDKEDTCKELSVSL